MNLYLIEKIVIERGWGVGGGGGGGGEGENVCENIISQFFLFKKPT